MNEAGFAKDREGFFASPTGERVAFDLQRINGSEFERIQLIFVDAWRRVGFDVYPTNLPAAQIGAGEQRHTFRGITQKGGMWPEVNFTTPQIGTPENRWTGENRGGWSNADYDQLYERFTKTLDRAERTGQFVQMQQLISEQLPVLFTHYATSAIVTVAGLRGPLAGSAGTGTFTSGSLANWNLHEWEWQ
jgi:ABC-type transport system substrate-binding protein